MNQLYGPKWYKSKTLWAAVGVGLTGVACVLVQEELVTQDVAGFILMAVAVIQGILRVITTGPIRL
jgi:heme/copper-type cytochrome/quinol oxidase subunit 4